MVLVKLYYCLCFFNFMSAVGVIIIFIAFSRWFAIIREKHNEGRMDVKH